MPTVSANHIPLPQFVTSYRIFPPIGIARIGDCTEVVNGTPVYYLAPEEPQTNFVPRGGFRDGQGRLHRMGQRFRIYEFVNGIPVKEITANEAKITWTVHLCNSKAASNNLNPGIPRPNLTIDSGLQSVSGLNQNHPVNASISPLGPSIPVPLGNLLTDGQGRLIVLGGYGNSKSWTNPPSPVGSLHNNGWFDDVSDGSVTATVQLNGSAGSVAAEAAWIIVGPPDYAHAMRPVISIADWADNFTTSIVPSMASFTQDIYPALQAAVFLQWTSSDARNGHAQGAGNFLNPAVFILLHDKNVAGGAQKRQQVFAKLRNPDGTGTGTMPLLSANPTLTPRQYHLFSLWANGHYFDDWDPSWPPDNPPQPPLASYPISQQPQILTQAGSYKGVGGAFFPGIEAGQIVSQPSTYLPSGRIASAIVKPGDLTQPLSVPWQDDFSQCIQTWWPSGRPGSVFVGANPMPWNRNVADGKAMVQDWAKLGFIIQDPSNPHRYTEQQRTLP